MLVKKTKVGTNEKTNINRATHDVVGKPKLCS